MDESRVELDLEYEMIGLTINDDQPTSSIKNVMPKSGVQDFPAPVPSTSFLRIPEFGETIPSTSMQATNIRTEQINYTGKNKKCRRKLNFDKSHKKICKHRTKIENFPSSVLNTKNIPKAVYLKIMESLKVDESDQTEFNTEENKPV